MTMILSTFVLLLHVCIKSTIYTMFYLKCIESLIKYKYKFATCKVIWFYTRTLNKTEKHWFSSHILIQPYFNNIYLTCLVRLVEQSELKKKAMSKDG